MFFEETKMEYRGSSLTQGYQKELSKIQSSCQNKKKLTVSRYPICQGVRPPLLTTINKSGVIISPQPPVRMKFNLLQEFYSGTMGIIK